MLKRIAFIFIVALSFTSCSSLFDSYRSEIDGVYIPKNLDDALSEVNNFYSDSLKTEIIKLSEADFVGDYHFGTGLWMRNNWGLWQGSRLSRYFRRIGINHPDDMSGIILVSYHRQLSGKDIALKKQIAEYKEYWKESKKLYKLAKLPKKSRQPENDLEFGYLMWYTNNDKASLLHLQTNSEADSLWIYDYLYGWKKIRTETAANLKEQHNFKTDSLLNTIFKN